MNKVLRNSVGVIYSGIIGAIVGFLSWIFLYMVYLGIHLFWHEFILEKNSKVLIIAVCLIGGVCVGLCEKYIGKYPKTLHMVLHEFKSTGKVEYKSLPKAIIKIFTVLWFGGTVGPEAGLSGILGGLTTYVGEFLKFGFIRREHEKINVSGVNEILEIPKYGFYNFVDKSDNKKVKSIKRLLYGSGILFGIAMFVLLNMLDNKASFITKFAHSAVDKISLIYLVPLFIVGLLIVAYSAILDKIIPVIFRPLEKYKIFNSIIGGLILGIIAISIPYILFSGEHSLKELIGGSSILGVGVLILIGAFKLIASKICIQTGWIGGPIFPIMFASAAFAIAFSQIFDVNMPFAVAIVMSTALAGIMQNFKITVVLLIFFFSLNTWLFMLIVAFLAELIVKKCQSLKNHS
ncbi:MAG: chloride channel protein [Sarcina sp.]